VEEGHIEHILIHMRNRIGIGTVLDERGRGESLKWMRKVKKLKGIHRSVRECGYV